MALRKERALSLPLSCRLTPAEMDERNHDMAVACGTVQRHEAAEAVAKAGHAKAKRDLQAQTAKRDLIAKVIVSGTEERDVVCDETLDYERSRVIVTRHDTGEVVGVRDMTERESQMTAPGMLAPGTGKEVDVDQMEADIRVYFQRTGGGGD